MYETLSGKAKAAILLITLGEDKSANIFKHMKDEDINTIVLEIANTTRVTPDTREAVLEEFYEMCIAQRYITEGGIESAKSILEKAYGPEKAQEILSKLTASLGVRRFDFLRKIDAGQIANLLQAEGNYTIALVLSYLTPVTAAEVLISMSPDVQADITRRIASLEGVTPETIKDLEQVLERKVNAIAMGKSVNVGGVDAVAEILNLVGRDTERGIIGTLDTEDPELAEEIRKRMFTFEDLGRLLPTDIQIILREVEQTDLVLSLKGVNDEIKEAILAQVSKRRRGDIEEELSYIGPVRRTDVDEAQQKILAIVRKLSADNKIEMSKSSDNDFV